MSDNSGFVLQASYNAWMNQRLYECAGHLSDDQLWQDRGAYFSSIMGTLNHIVVGDILWLQRFNGQIAEAPVLSFAASLPKPLQLNQVLEEDLIALKSLRQGLDKDLVMWCEGLPHGAYQCVVEYRNTKGQLHRKPLGQLLQHVFNHQTHHRGQISALLSQAGLDVGATDLVCLIDDVPPPSGTAGHK